MGALQKRDLRWLEELDERPPPAGASAEADEGLKRLLKAGFIDEQLNLTVEGIETLEKVKAILPQLRKGVPISSRKTSNPSQAYEENNASIWFTGTVGKKPVVSNGQLIYVGAPVKGMPAEKGSSDRRRMFPVVVARQKGDYVPVTPTHYQTDGSILGPAIVWLRNVEKGVSVAIQAMYYDFVMDKFPSAAWLAAEDKTLAVKAVVRGKGVTKDNVVAFVMPFLARGWKEPWRADETMQD